MKWMYNNKRNGVNSNRVQIIILVLIILDHGLPFSSSSNVENRGLFSGLLDSLASSASNSNSTQSFIIPSGYDKLHVPPKPITAASASSTGIPPVHHNSYWDKQDALFLEHIQMNDHIPSSIKLSTSHSQPSISQGEDLPSSDSYAFLDKISSKLKVSNSISVDTRIIIQKIRKIDEINEKITMDMDIILSWVDWSVFEASKTSFAEGSDQNILRKLITTETLDASTLKKIWKPDVFIENAVSIKKATLISEPVKLLYSTSDGKFIYITRAAIKTSCQMEFQYYPSDTQNCVVKIRSYSHSTDKLKLRWDKTLGGVFIMDRDDDNFDIRISSIEKPKAVLANDVAHLDVEHKYYLLEYTISARRKLSYHLIQTYLPSLFFVLITWLCFLIPSNLFEARIGVTMTTLLTLTSMFASVRENTPIVSYVRAIDIWMAACIYFVFLTLLGFTLLKCLRSRRNKQIQLKAQRKRRVGIGSIGSESRTKLLQQDPESMQSKHASIKSKSPVFKKIKSFLARRGKLRQAKDRVSDLIEKYSFLSFSILFVLFNLIYWIWLFVANGYFDWDVDLRYNSP